MQQRIRILVLLTFLVSSLHGQWRAQQLDDGDMAADLAEALTFTKYPTYPQYLEILQLFARDYPDICRVDTFGTSSQGRLLLAVKISNNVQKDEAEASFFYTSSMHGDELVAYPMMLRLINYLLAGYGNDAEVGRLVDGLAIWINPLANPDGTYYPNDDFSVVYSQRETADGTDMNREFPDPAAGEAVNDTAGRAKETKAMMAFLQEHSFNMSANIHSGAEVVNYPWDHTYTLHADNDWFHFVAREYADEARAVDSDYMALFDDGITNGAQWYRINGGRQDYVTFYLGGRELTLELANETHLDSELLNEYWMKNERSLLNYMAQCLYGIRGQVSDSESGAALGASIEIPGYDQDYSLVFSSPGHGDFYRFLEEGSYELVVSAPGYITDTIPIVQVEAYKATLLDIKLELAINTVETEDAFSTRLYPNPAGDRLYINPGSIEPGPFDLMIISMEGVILLREVLHFSGSPLEIGLEQVPAGPYLVKLSSGTFSAVKMMIRE